MTLRFDASAALRHCFALWPEGEQTLWPQLNRLRQGWTARPVPDEQSQPNEPNFYELPMAQGEAYRLHREASTLGRVFKVANSLMDQVDAFVIIGQGNGYFGPLAMKDVNTDPYHNEQRRGPRGGKPRLYFAGPSLDNDSIQALLWRLKAGGYSETHHEHRFGIVLIDTQLDAQTLWPLFQHIHQAFGQSLSEHATDLGEQLIVPILRHGSELAKRCDSIACANRFWIPDSVAPGYELMTPVGLLPAALLGHDIMKLLEGAVALNERFQQTPVEREPCCQLAALQFLQHRLGTHPWQPERSQAAGMESHAADHPWSHLQLINMWDAALEPLARWNQWLLDHSWSHCRGGPLSGCTLLPRDRERFERWRPVSLTHHLLVDKCRTDPLADMIVAQQACLDQTLSDSAFLSTGTHLSTIDTYVLGQWFQMQMIATQLTQLLLTVP